MMKEFAGHLAHILHKEITSPHYPHHMLINNPLFKVQINLGVNICECLFILFLDYLKVLLYSSMYYYDQVNLNI